MDTSEISLEQIISKNYLTVNDIYQILPVGKNRAQQIFNDMYKELVDEHYPLSNMSRNRTIPTKRFLKRYKI